MHELFDSDLVIHERLAAGGMGEVHRATQIGLGGFRKPVAVKRILPSIAADTQKFEKLFLRETAIAANLQHPNIAQVFRNGRSEGHLYVVMEFIEGKDVEALLATTISGETWPN